VLFFTIYPNVNRSKLHGFLRSVYVDNFQIGYIFLANIIASYLLTLLSPDYVYLNWKIDTDLWKRMMRYGMPIMVAGIACHQRTVR
jgi:hypothetical protein